MFSELPGDQGGAEGADDLGLRRAAAVLRHLNMEQGFPLHRMSVISYGESRPAEENDSPAGRAHNRRVALVVLK